MRGRERFVAQQRVVVGDGRRAAPAPDSGSASTGYPVVSAKPATASARPGAASTRPHTSTPRGRLVRPVSTGARSSSGRGSGRATSSEHVAGASARAVSSPGRGSAGTSGSRSAKLRWTTPGRPSSAVAYARQASARIQRSRSGVASCVPTSNEPLGRGAVQLDLVDHLAGAHLAQLGRAVGGEHDQRDARLVGLVDRRRQVGRRRARRAGHDRRVARRPWPGRARRSPRSARPRATSSAARARAPAPAPAGRCATRATCRRRSTPQRASSWQNARSRTWASVAVMMSAWPPAIVFLHGFTAHGASWRAGDRRARATLPRARARHPRSRRGRRPARPIGFARVRGRRGRGRRPTASLLVGYSLGARLALHVALAHPRAGRAARAGQRHGRDRRRGRARPAPRRRRRAGRRRSRPQTIEAFAARWARAAAVQGASAPRWPQAAHADRLRNTPAGLAAALRGAGRRGRWSRCGRAWASCACRSTVIVGERDAQVTASWASAWRPPCPTPSWWWCPAAGHAVHLEAPALVAACLRERLAANGRAGTCCDDTRRDRAAVLIAAVAVPAHGPGRPRWRSAAAAGLAPRRRPADRRGRRPDGRPDRCASSSASG